MGLSSDEILSIFKVVSIILKLGKVHYSFIFLILFEKTLPFIVFQEI